MSTAVSTTCSMNSSSSSSVSGSVAVASTTQSTQPTPTQSPINKPDAKATKKSQKPAAATAATPPAAKQPKAKSAKADTGEPKPKKSAAEPADGSKKHPAKQQPSKIVREKERKDKQLKQAATETPAASKAAASSSSSAPPMSRLQEMEQDGVKSRNHRLFLAPSLRHSREPCWSARLARDARAESVAERLHDEILEYAKYTRATVDAMTVHIEQMIAHVRRCVHALWPKSKMEPFGSYSTGIWLPSSDVDLVILGVVEIHDRSLTVKSLRQLARALESQPWVESLVVLDTAKIPVLKLVTAESSVPIDVTFESTATHSGLLARDLIKRYADEMPELYPLAVVFKQLLRERDLNDAYTGGLSSYSVVLMIIHFQLLWRYGGRCFKAAAVFASGSPLPRPADLIAEEELAKQKLAAEEEKAAAAAAAPTITSSFASVVARSKGVKRPASKAGRTGAGTATSSGDALTAKQTTTAAASSPPAPAQPFSYAAVAAGIAKLTTEETSKAPTAPSSYAAAVAAPPQVTAAKAKALAASRSAAATATKAKTSDGVALDAVSVTSSTADTEDSASCSDSSTTTSAHDDCADDVHSTKPAASSLSGAAAAGGEDASGEPDEPPELLSLGERTMTILEFFGIVFDYRKNGLSIRDGGYIYRLADHVGASGDLCKKLPALVIEDPIHPDRNVSASSFAFSKVVAVFEDSFYALKYFRPSRFTPSALSCLLSTSGHSLHQYQQQFHHLLAAKHAAPAASTKRVAVAAQ